MKSSAGLSREGERTIPHAQTEAKKSIIPTKTVKSAPGTVWDTFSGYKKKMITPSREMPMALVHPRWADGNLFVRVVWWILHPTTTVRRAMPPTNAARMYPSGKPVHTEE